MNRTPLISAGGAAGLVLGGCLAMANHASAQYPPTQRVVHEGGSATPPTGSGSTSRLGPATSGEMVLPGGAGAPGTDSINAAAEAARMGGPIAKGGASSARARTSSTSESKERAQSVATQDSAKAQPARGSKTGTKAAGHAGAAASPGHG